MLFLTHKKFYAKIFAKTSANKQKIPSQERYFPLYICRPLKNLWVLAYRGTVHRYVLLILTIFRFFLCSLCSYSINYYEGSIDFKILCFFQVFPKGVYLNFKHRRLLFLQTKVISLIGFNHLVMQQRLKSSVPVTVIKLITKTSKREL